MIPLITLEEHFVSKIALENPVAVEQLSLFPEKLRNNLEDLKGQRLDSLNSSNVAVQILSHVPCPGIDTPEFCAAVNDEVAAAIKDEPRLTAFAFLPMDHPDDAIKELRRCVQELGFPGALIDAHSSDGAYYDTKIYRSFWAAAEQLDVPIYLHPSWPSEKVSATGIYGGDFSREIEVSLGAFAWGWHSDAGLSLLRLYASGLFDEHPSLKIVMGHMGEMIPYMMERIEHVTSRWGKKRSLQDMWTSNVWVTTSGMFSLNSMQCLLGVTPVERVLCSVDYPFSENEQGRDFLERLEESGMVTSDEVEMIAHRNAASLLRIRVPTQAETVDII